MPHLSTVLPQAMPLQSTTATITPPADTSSIARNIGRVSNACLGLTGFAESAKFAKPIIMGTGKKINSFHSSFDTENKSIRKLRVILNKVHGDAEDLSASRLDRRKAYKDKNIDFVKFGQNKTAIQFRLPNNPENRNIELERKRTLGKDVESIYTFRIKINKASRDTVFFQIKNTSGQDSGPVLALSVRQGNQIFLTLKDAGRGYPTPPAVTYRYPSDERVAFLLCAQKNWYNFKVKVVWNHEDPSVQLGINDNTVFEFRGPFGYPSGRHYSSFGACSPNRSGPYGGDDTVIMFDRFREDHLDSTISSVPKPAQSPWDIWQEQLATGEGILVEQFHKLLNRTSLLSATFP